MMKFTFSLKECCFILLCAIVAIAAIPTHICLNIKKKEERGDENLRGTFYVKSVLRGTQSLCATLVTIQE